MVVTTTAVAFILLGLGLGLCGWWFLKAFNGKKTDINQRKDKVGLLLSTFLFLSGAQNGMIGLGSLLFSTNQSALFFTLILSEVLLILSVLFGVYSVYYIFFPKLFSRSALYVFTFLGYLLILLSFIFRSQAIITPEKDISWVMNPLVAVLTLFFVLTSIGSFIFIFSQLFLKGPTSGIKTLSGALAVLGFAGLTNVCMRFATFIGFQNDFHSIEISMGLIAVGIIIVLFSAPHLRRLPT